MRREMKEKMALVRFLFVGFLSLSLIMFAESTSFASTVLLKWSSNPDPDLAGYRVYYKAGSAELPFDGVGAVEGVAPIDVANQTSATITGLDPGTDYYFAVTAYNTSGIESDYSDTIAIPGTKDVTAPTVSFTSPNAGATLGGIVTINSSASDDIGVSRVEYYQNGALIAAGNMPPYSYKWDTNGIANGSYTLTAKAYDAAGNVGTSAVDISVLNDSIPPSVALDSPGAATTVGGAVSVSATAIDNVGIAKVEFYVNGALQGSSTTAPYHYEWNTTGLTNGTYTLTALAYDTVGNVGQASSVPVNVFNDTTAPTITFLAPTTTFVYSNNVKISAAATDNVSVTKMELYINDTLQYTTSNSSFTVAYKFPVGVNYVTVKAYDAANNVQTASQNINRFK